MKKFVLSFMLLLFALPGYAAVDYADSVLTLEALTPEKEHKTVSNMVSNMLMRNHYKKRAVDDDMSTEIFDRYLENLDGGKLYFLASDIKSFQKYRFLMDDFVLNGRVDPAFDIFNIYRDRVIERLDYIFARIQGEEFDYTIDESIDIEREDDPWAETTDELDELWRKRLKHAALSLKLAGKDWEDIQETLRKRYERTKRNVAQYQSEDVFQLFMNAMAESYDPHTSYYSPKSTDNFRIQMSQSLEGIGARLTTEDEFVKVSEIVPGGPADKGGELHPDDRIIGVGQNVDGEIVDVIGWRLDDVVQLIRGDKGTTVRLQILPADEPEGIPPTTIAIVRDKIKLEDQSAKSEILEVEHEGQTFRFGVIEIPTFYADSDGMRAGEKDYKSTSHDTRRLIEELETEDIDGLIVDLRRNGGGYLSEAVNLTGLFIDRGPVVQVRDTSGRTKVHEDTKNGVAYDGPLAVLVDRFSASASEIFAAAIQDYDRGIVIGGQSFGKGTVQNAIDLNRFVRNPDLKLGQLKLTVAKFYRIDGRSTQHVGVSPDIGFPSRFGVMEVGESSRENALAYDTIEPLTYQRLNDTFISDLVPRLKQQQTVRLSHNDEYTVLLDEIAEFEENQNRTEISLNEEVRRQEKKDSQEDDAEEADDAEENSAEADDAEDAEDGSEAEEDESPHDKDDLLLTESAHILGDYILLSDSEKTAKAK